MTPLSKLRDGELLRPEPRLRESDGNGGGIFIALVFAGLAIFATSSADLHQLANVSVKCPVAAVTYCDRQ